MEDLLSFRHSKYNSKNNVPALQILTYDYCILPSDRLSIMMPSGYYKYLKRHSNRNKLYNQRKRLGRT